MEVDKDKLIQLLVSSCPHMVTNYDGTGICRPEFEAQCHALLPDRYGKCPDDCPHMNEAAAEAHCKGGKCTRIKKLIKMIQQ